MSEIHIAFNTLKWQQLTYHRCVSCSIMGDQCVGKRKHFSFRSVNKLAFNGLNLLYRFSAIITSCKETVQKPDTKISLLLFSHSDQKCR